MSFRKNALLAEAECFRQTRAMEHLFRPLRDMGAGFLTPAGFQVG